MFAIIIGGGRTGSYLAGTLIKSGNDVVVMEKKPEVFAKLAEEIESRIVQADGCDPEQLELVGIGQADLVVAMTGDDEDNLVVSWLAKYVYNVKRVIARVNNPRNRWLFSAEWGVDAAVSAVHIISKLIEEEASLGEIVTLLKLGEGDVSLVELTIPEGSPSAGVPLRDLSIPDDAVLVTIVRDGRVLIPSSETMLEGKDEVLAVVSPASERQLVDAIGAQTR